MHVVILAAGANTRFFPLNGASHKGGVTLLGKPLIHRTLENMAQAGVHKVTIVISPRDEEAGGLKSQIESLKTTLEISFVVQAEANGMGEALLLARAKLPEQFAVISPYHMNAGELLSELKSETNGCVVGYTHTNEPWNYGMLSLEGSTVTALIEKPAPGTEPSSSKILSLYQLNHHFLNILAELPTSHYSFEEALKVLISQKQLIAQEITQPVLSLKYAWHVFDAANMLFKEVTATNVHPQAIVAETAVIDDSTGPVIIEAGAKVGHHARIAGPAYVGRNTLVGDYSLVRGSSLEAGVQVGSYTEVVRSIMLPGSHIHYGYLADSILGHEVRVGAGLITANKRLDRDIVKTELAGKKVATGRTALGIIVGDKANLGIRVSTMPGVLIGAKASVYPGVIVYKNVSAAESVK